VPAPLPRSRTRYGPFHGGCYRVFFKAGWRPTALGQIARLEGHHRVFSLAIMTDGDPSMDYGIQTLDIVARALL
jgi:hypothetical protein